MSPRLSPEQLQEARQRKRAQEAETQRLQAEKAEMQEQQNQELIKLHRMHDELASLVESIYLEMDKLNKKSPMMRLTPLSLKKVNEAITDAKHLVSSGSVLDRITVFEPAGDMPEYRDVVLILSQVRTALERSQKNLPARPPRTELERLIHRLDH